MRRSGRRAVHLLLELCLALTTSAAVAKARPPRQETGLSCASVEDCLQRATKLKQERIYHAAYRLLTQACQKGHAASCLEAVELVDRGWLWPELKELRQLYQKACKLDRHRCGEQTSFDAFLKQLPRRCTPDRRECGLVPYGGDLKGMRPVLHQMHLCQDRYLPACRQLAELYLDGKGGPSDLEQALSLLARACRGHDSASCAVQRELEQKIACSDKNDCRAKADQQKHDFARALLGQACALGDGAACRLAAGYYFGSANYHGHANAYYHRGCLLGDASSCVAFAEGLQVLNLGQPTPAVALLQGKACLLDNTEACAKALALYDKNPAWEPDQAKLGSYRTSICREWERTTVLRHDQHNNQRWILGARHCLALAQIDYAAAERLGPKHSQQRELLYGSACRRGLGGACAKLVVPCAEAEKCHKLGDQYRDPMPPLVKDLHAAAALYRQACALKRYPSCVYYADILSRGEGYPHDQATARRYYQAACDLELGAGCEGLASYHPRGSAERRQYQELCCKHKNSLTASLCCLEVKVQEFGEALKQAEQRRAQLAQEQRARREQLQRGEATPGMVKPDPKLVERYQFLVQLVHHLDQKMDDAKPRYGQVYATRQYTKLGESRFIQVCANSNCYQNVYLTNKTLVGGNPGLYQKYEREYDQALAELKEVTRKLQKAGR